MTNLRQLFVCGVLSASALLAANGYGEVSCPHALPDSPADRDILLKLYCDTGGQNWTRQANWGSAQLSEWQGVTVHPTEREEVYALKLDGNNLSGTIPAELAALRRLAQLELSNNRLNGTIPASLGGLRRLLVLDLRGNHLEGTIPLEIWNLPGLFSLSVANNHLRGAIPTTGLPSLDLVYLDLSNNRLSGTIPAALGKSKKLLTLRLSHNHLSGTVPAELGNLATLDWLDLGNNGLSGDIPAELGNLKDLRRLHLHNNNLGGTLPAELGNLSSLTQLWLHNNKQLGGTLPAELRDVSDLRLEGTRVVVAPEVCIASGPDVTEGDDATFSLTAEPALAVAITIEIELKVLGDYAPHLTADSATLVQVQIPTGGAATYTVATVDDDTEEPDGFIVASLVAGHGYDVCEENVAAVSVTDDDDLQTRIETHIDEAVQKGNATNERLLRRALAAVRGEAQPAGKRMTGKVAQRIADRAGKAGKVEKATLWQRIADSIGSGDDDCVGADLHDRVRGHHASPPSEAAKARWAAVLQAFGDDMGVTAMAAAEAQAYHDRGPAWREKWAGIPEAIRCLENAAVSAVVNGPVVTLTWEASRDGFGSPSGSDYGVRVNGVARAVASADLAGDTAWLVLDSPAAAGDDVTVSYLGSAMHPLADASGRLRPGPWDGLAAKNLTGIEQPAPPAMVVDGRPADPFAAAAIDTSTLDASGLGLTGLGGVARLVALERLDLSDNAMSDLSPLAGLGNLRELDLSGNGAVDLWPLAGLHRLERLDLSDNAVTDVQALAGLSGLKVLLLDGNAVADVWPLAGLRRLESLGLSGNRIGEVAALQDLARLRRLDLSGNPLGDLSPLGDVGSLVWLALPGETPGDSVTLGRLARLRWVWPGTVRLPSVLEVEAPR